jgi:hypothetical protein
MKKDKWVKRWKVAGSNGNEWTVAIDKDGNYGCSCPVWKFKREECHHIAQIKMNGGNEIKSREARPGNVPEVVIDGDIVLYPLVPIPSGPDLPATIIYDMIRANVSLEQIKDYAKRMFRDASLKQIKAHVEERGRLVFSHFEKGQGWVNPVFTAYDLPLKTIDQIR